MGQSVIQLFIHHTFIFSTYCVSGMVPDIVNIEIKKSVPGLWQSLELWTGHWTMHEDSNHSW